MRRRQWPSRLEEVAEEYAEAVETLLDMIDEDDLVSPAIAARAKTVGVKLTEFRRALNALQAETA